MICQEIIPLFGADFPKKVISLIHSATKEIDIIIFDWRWYPLDPSSSCQQFNNALISAVRRGVRVRVVTNCAAISDYLKPLGIYVKKPISARLLHSKIMIVDEKHLVIGSHNYTQNAFTSNFETSVLLLYCDDLSDYSKYFNSLYF